MTKKMTTRVMMSNLNVFGGGGGVHNYRDQIKVAGLTVISCTCLE